MIFDKMNIVHNGGKKLHVPIISKETILEVSRQLVMKKGLSAINMRLVANECGIALGSVYNYFPSKADLIASTIESVWKDIFQIEESFYFENFIDCLSCFFSMIKQSSVKYPEFFTLHSMSFATDERVAGRQLMEEYLTHLKDTLLNTLIKDKKVRKDAFNDTLTPSDFVNYIFTLFISLLLQKQEHCQSLLELVRHCIY